MTYTPVTSCRSCGDRDLRDVLDLGDQPLANSYPDAAAVGREERYPLHVLRCGRCSLVQLAGTVDPKVMFDDYLYFSSFSVGMTSSAAALAARLVEERELGADDLVVEVASNDGYLLKHYQQLGVDVLGVEPAANVAAVAEAAGVPTVVDYFGRRLAGALVAEGRAASIVHVNNVLAHVPDINDFVAGIAALLRPGGIAVIETPWVLDFVSACEFDTVYHEHVFYHSLTALTPLFERHGLDVVDVERLNLHGGSLRVSAARGAGVRSTSVDQFLEQERQAGVDEDTYYADFAERVENLKVRTMSILRRERDKGATVAAYGAAAKGTVLLNHFGIDLSLVDFVVDRNPHKQGRRMPGVGIPVLAPEALLERQPDLVLMLVWNFADEVLEQQAEYRNRGGRFLLPVPDAKVV